MQVMATASYNVMCLNSPAESEKYRLPAKLGVNANIGDLKRWIATIHQVDKMWMDQRISVYYDLVEMSSLDHKLSYYIGGNWTYHVHKIFTLVTPGENGDSVSRVCRLKGKHDQRNILSTVFSYSIPKGYKLDDSYSKVVDLDKLENGTVFRIVPDPEYSFHSCQLRTHFDNIDTTVPIKRSITAGSQFDKLLFDCSCGIFGGKKMNIYEYPKEHIRISAKQVQCEMHGEGDGMQISHGELEPTPTCYTISLSPLPDDNKAYVVINGIFKMVDLDDTFSEQYIEQTFEDVVIKERYKNHRVSPMGKTYREIRDSSGSKATHMLFDTIYLSHGYFLLKTLTGAMCEMDADASDTIGKVKKSIYDMRGTPADQQYLCWNGMQLEDLKTLADYGIHRNQIIHLILRLRGGGCSEFADVSRESAFRNHDWADSAPKWRTASRGLCIEGRCDNVQCEAYRKMVIVNMGFRKFDLIIDGDTCKCPMCSKPVKPITCAFNNCWWKFSGIKRGGQRVNKSWQRVRDHYQRCEDQETGVVMWDRFLLTVVSDYYLYSVKPESNKRGSSAKPKVEFNPDLTHCSICLEHIRSGSQLMECKHCYHTECISNWLEISPSCPMCRYSKPTLLEYALKI